MGRFQHILLLISIAVSLTNSVPVAYNEKGLPENDDSEVAGEQIEIVNEKANNSLFEGDIIPDENGPQDENEKRNAQRDRKRLWMTKVVPYVIDQALISKTGVFDQAFQEFHIHTCLLFVPHTNEKNWIYFVEKNGCYSSVGKTYWRSGGQDVSIGRGCASKGIIIHELLHALGFWHEQSRPDRDQYVRILWENIKPGKEHNFNKYSHGTIDNLKATYDLNSIMHYGKYSFSKNRKPTIEAISNPNQQLGQRNGFSQTDIYEVNALYDCSGPSHGWSSWSGYGPCDSSCDRIRQRFCASSDRNNCPGADAYGVQKEETKCPGCIVPEDCEFETGFCIWASDSANIFKWLRRQGKTPSANTGPDGDATKTMNGNGYYIYAESSSPVQPNQKTQLTSPVFNATSGSCLEFAYSMYGPAMGSLDVYVEDATTGTMKNIFTKSGNQGQGWHRAKATITSSSDYKVVFEVTRGSSYQSDVALDDIFFKDGKCGGQGPASTTSPPTTTAAPTTTEATTTTPPTTTAAPTTTEATTSPPTTTAAPTTTEATTTTPPTTTAAPTTTEATTTTPPTTTAAPTTTEATTTTPPTTTAAPTTAGPFPTTQVLGDDCDFDQDMCGWTPGNGTNKETNKYPWTRRSGRTPSWRTGPSRDHTSGSGSYVYVETSRPARPGQTANLVSKDFSPAPAGRCMSFYYHMYGRTMGTLNVYIRGLNSCSTRKVFTKSGNQGNRWLDALVNIKTSYQYQIIFESVRGRSYTSDIAIDDITFTNAPCT